MGRSRQTLNIKIGDHTLNQVQSFTFLGSTVNEQSKQEDEIKNRIAKYSQNVGCVYKLRKDRNVPKKAKRIIQQTILRPILIFGSEWGTLTKRLEQPITTADMKVIRMIQGVTRCDRKRDEDVNKQSNMLPIVQVINTNKLRWFGHVIRREVESTLKVVMKLKMKGKRPRGRPRLRWLDNIDSQLKGKNTSLKEVLETKCFENRKYWRTSISYSTDSSSGEDQWTPTWSMVSEVRWETISTSLWASLHHHFSVLSVFRNVCGQFICFHISPVAVDPYPPRPPPLLFPDTNMPIIFLERLSSSLLLKTSVHTNLVVSVSGMLTFGILWHHLL